MRRIAWVLLLGSLSLSAQSQLGTGAIAGGVTDPSGQVVPGAAILVSGKQTGLIREATSAANGTFTLPVLPPGAYRVRISKDGFARLEQDNVEVTVGNTATVIARLQVGALSETVTVSEQAVLIDTTNTSDVSSTTHSQRRKTSPARATAPAQARRHPSAVIAFTISSMWTATGRTLPPISATGLSPLVSGSLAVASRTLSLAG
jgi:hypothetical protein